MKNKPTAKDREPVPVFGVRRCSECHDSKCGRIELTMVNPIIVEEPPGTGKLMSMVQFPLNYMQSLIEELVTLAREQDIEIRLPRQKNPKFTHYLRLLIEAHEALWYAESVPAARRPFPGEELTEAQIHNVESVRSEIRRLLKLEKIDIFVTWQDRDGTHADKLDPAERIRSSKIK